MSRLAFLVVLISLIFALAGFAQTPDEPGPGEVDFADATPTGAFTTAIPVRLPSAREPVPRIALRYSSQSGNRLAGMGWSLSGFPAVVRGRGDSGISFDSTQSTFTSDQFYYLAGGLGTAPIADNQLKYVTRSGPFGMPDRFHLVKNTAGASFLAFQVHGYCRNGPCYWTMRDGRGTTYYFGGDEAYNAAPTPTDPTPAIDSALWEPDSGMKDANGDLLKRGIVAWGIYKVVDPDGNHYLVRYLNDGQAFRPSEVSYNLPVAPNGRFMRVSFEYVARPDPTPMPARFEHRLNKVRVQADCRSTGSCSLVRAYQLTYTQTGSSPSLLTSVTELGSDDGPVGLPSQTFTYTSTAPPAPKAQTLSSAFSLAPGCTGGRTLTGDIDGDGRTDVVRGCFNTTPARMQYTCARDTGLTGAVQSLPSLPSPDSSRVFLPALADVNGDGKADLVVVQAVHATAQFRTHVAFGQAGCTFGVWQGPFVENNPLGTRMSTGPFSWRLLAADIDGDARSDLVLYDDGDSLDHTYWDSFTGQITGYDPGWPSAQRFRRRLYYKLATASGGTPLAAIAGFRAEISPEWTECSTGSYPDQFTFNGITSTDVNGDGKADIVASWAAAPGAAGKITVMTARGSTGGLRRPREECQGAAAFPYLALRTGDVNGDGLQDVLFAYEGERFWGDRPGRGGLGRSLRQHLGTTAPSVSNPISSFASHTDSSPYYSSSTDRPAHLNGWEFHVRDLSGDGIDDFCEVYRGSRGGAINCGLGSPRGMAQPSFNLANSEASPLFPYADGSTESFPRWLSAMGNLDNDGRADLVLVGGGNNPTPAMSYFMGGPTGLNIESSGLTDVTFYAGPSRNLSLRLVDLNADGRDDVLLVNDNLNEPTASQIAFSISPFLSDADFPWLLRTIDNGLAGVTTVQYQLARDFRDSTGAPTAVRPESPIHLRRAGREHLRPKLRRAQRATACFGIPHYTQQWVRLGRQQSPANRNHAIQLLQRPAQTRGTLGARRLGLSAD